MRWAPALDSNPEVSRRRTLKSTEGVLRLDLRRNPFGVQRLQRDDTQRAFLQRGDPLSRGLRSRQRGDRGNSRQHRSPPNRLLIEERILTARRIDDQLNTIALDQI